jgi:lipopolysaccharide/colanic/teichoic acid biosynthesis glycosyltransferase
MRLASSGTPVARLRVTRPGYDLLKRCLDLVVTALLIPFAVPIIAVAYVSVRLTSRGPGFYAQTRVGRFGQPYEIYKLRSMYHNCELTSGPRWCTPGDNRVTPVGRWIRKLHVDELPQLWNIFTGAMSLVGPRPERPEFVAPLQTKIPGYVNRLAVRPGLTGLAQVQLPPDNGLESVKAKTVLDLYYVNNCSLWLDMRILFGTVAYVLGMSFSAIRVAAGLPKPADYRAAADDAELPDDVTAGDGVALVSEAPGT